MNHHSTPRRWRLALAALTLAVAALPALAQTMTQATPATPTSLTTLQRDMQVGDLVFIRVKALPFAKVAVATGSWTNHVGVVIDTSGAEPMIGESTFPVSKATNLSRFVARSEGGRVAVMRLDTPLTDAQRDRVRTAAEARMGIVYDTGFDLHSPRQFCSRYAREVLIEATGTSVGEVETFAHLLERNPSAGLGFWRVWYFGRIPWTRETVTPASLLQSARVHATFDGRVSAGTPSNSSDPAPGA
jgi:hypothetical protein